MAHRKAETAKSCLHPLLLSHLQPDCQPSPTGLAPLQVGHQYRPVGSPHLRPNSPRRRRAVVHCVLDTSGITIALAEVRVGPEPGPRSCGGQARDGTDANIFEME